MAGAAVDDGGQAGRRDGVDHRVVVGRRPHHEAVDGGLCDAVDVVGGAGDRDQRQADALARAHRRRRRRGSGPPAGSRTRRSTARPGRRRGCRRGRGAASARPGAARGSRAAEPPAGPSPRSPPTRARAASRRRTPSSPTRRRRARRRSSSAGAVRRPALMACSLAGVHRCVSLHNARPERAAVDGYAGFAVFGAFWGVWGASIPAIRDQAGVSDGAARHRAAVRRRRRAAGDAAQRTRRRPLGLRATAALLALFGAAGLLVAAAARDFVTLALALALLGASSGAADVAINTAAGRAQRAYGSPGRHARARQLLRGRRGREPADRRTARARRAGRGAVRRRGRRAAAVAIALARDRRAPGLELRRAGGAPARPARVGGPAEAAARPRRARRARVRGRERPSELERAVPGATRSASAPAVAAAGPAVFAAVVAVTRFAAGESGRRRPAALHGRRALRWPPPAPRSSPPRTVARRPGWPGSGSPRPESPSLFPTLIVVLTADGARIAYAASRRRPSPPSRTSGSLPVRSTSARGRTPRASPARCSRSPVLRWRSRCWLP